MAVPHPRAKVFAARILAILAGLFAIAVGFGELLDLSMAGFPDGAVTEYDKAVRTPFTILSVISISTGLYFFYLSIFINRKRMMATIFTSLILYLILVPGIYFGIDYYLKTFTNINYGQGG
jgi:magnesium-transporting ATPase (P-type)